MLLLGSSGTGSHGDMAKAVDFDGTNDYMLRASDLTGNADGKTFTFSAWVWKNAHGFSRILDGNTGSADRVNFFNNSSNDIQIDLYDQSGGLTFSVSVSPSNHIPISSWIHILVSVDLTSTSNRAVYVNDVLQSLPTWGTYIDATIDWTVPKWGVGGKATDGTQKVTGRLAHVFLDYTYRDLSNVTNRRLFITADRKPAQGQAALNPILYLPMDDPTTAHINQGTGGNFTLNGVVARSGRGPNQYNAAYSTFDGSNDYMQRSALAGLSDGKQATVAFTIKNTSGSTEYILASALSSQFRFQIRVNDPNTLQIEGTTTSNTQVLLGNITIPTGYSTTKRNLQVVISFDLTNTANRHAYINGTACSVAWSAYTNADIQWTHAGSATWAVGANASVAASFTGQIGDVWFNPSYIDLSVAANLAKFVTGTGIDAKPVSLGANGELPTGTAPLIYLPMYGNNAGKNYGTGGDFTVFSGPFSGAKGPNEFWGNKAAATSGSYVGRVATPALTGVANAKIVSMSFFAAHTAGVRNDVVQCNTSTVLPLIVGTNGADKVWLQAWNSAGAQILDAVATSGESDTAVHHYCLSFDLSNASLRSVYVDGVAKSMAWNIYTNDSIPFASLINLYIGAMASSAATLAEFYLTTDYIDFSQEANRLLFRDAFGNPTDLPAAITAGTIPNPAIYMRFDPANQGLNSGTGGNFTKAGTITDGGQL